MTQKRKLIQFTPILAAFLVLFSTATFADTISSGEASSTSTTLDAVTLEEHTSYVSSKYFGILYLKIQDETIVQASQDTEGHVVISALSPGATQVEYLYRNSVSDDWVKATVPVTVT